MMILHRKNEDFLLRSIARIARESRSFLVAMGFAATLAAAASIAAPVSRADGDITLREGWTVQSSAKVSAGAENRERRHADVSDMMPYLKHFEEIFQFNEFCSKCGNAT